MLAKPSETFLHQTYILTEKNIFNKETKKGKKKAKATTTACL